MSLDWKHINECRQGYIDKRNAENADIALANDLNEEQIDAIEDICRLRHEIHSLDEDKLLIDGNGLIDRNLKEINELISKTDLPSLGIDEHTYEDDWLSDVDWDYCGAKDEYLKKAEQEAANGFEFDKPGQESKRFFPIYDIEELARRLFEEDATEVNSEIQEKINDTIEKWLAAIDEKCGTHYRPTGGQRLL